MPLNPAPPLGLTRGIMQIYNLIRGLPPSVIGEIVALIRDVLRGDASQAMRRAKALASETASEASIRALLRRKKL
jgi:hypothetical protein